MQDVEDPVSAGVVGRGPCSLPGVFARTNRSLCALGFKATIMGSNGSCSSASCCQISEEGMAGWCLTLKRVVPLGSVLLGCGVSSTLAVDFTFSNTRGRLLVEFID